jgi:hypothetical protein
MTRGLIDQPEVAENWNLPRPSSQLDIKLFGKVKVIQIIIYAQRTHEL